MPVALDKLWYSASSPAKLGPSKTNIEWSFEDSSPGADMLSGALLSEAVMAVGLRLPWPARRAEVCKIWGFDGYEATPPGLSC
jgi:hypothetical protein